MWERMGEFTMQTLVVGSGLSANSNLPCAGKFHSKANMPFLNKGKYLSHFE